eukprot:117-Hanusia_phi.AAC.2
MSLCAGGGGSHEQRRQEGDSEVNATRLRSGKRPEALQSRRLRKMPGNFGRRSTLKREGRSCRRSSARGRETCGWSS